MKATNAQETQDNHKRAREIVGWYTLAATGVGAVPVPATSVAIVANNGFMLAHVGATMGSVVTWEGVVSSLGVAGTLNIAGRTVFVEAGKALGWGTGSLWALAALSAVGASTAGLQTYILGLIAIEICRNGGQPIDAKQAARVIATGKETLSDFVAEMKEARPTDPGLPPVEAQAGVESAPLSALEGDQILRALSAVEDAVASMKGVATHAAAAIGTGVSSAGSAIRGSAADATGAIGSVFRRKQGPTDNESDPETVEE
jgi:hypothetical protein